MLALAGCGTKPEEAAKPVVVRAPATVYPREQANIAARMGDDVAAVTDERVTLERLRNGTLPGDLERARGQVATAEGAI